MARRIAATFERCSPSRSTSPGGTTTTDHAAARLTVVDRTNHYLFQPLLYQVAAAGLSAPEIAQPIRSILSARQDITVLLDQVTDFNLAARQVFLERETLQYDYLVLALGSCTSYFGHPEWEAFAPGLKTVEDALRKRIPEAVVDRLPITSDRIVEILSS